MQHIFIDTDIIIDFLGDRKPFSKSAALIFTKAQNKEIKLYSSSNSITTTYYILCKSLTEKSVRTLIPRLLKYIEVIPVNERILLQAFVSDFKDFEDAVQHASALTEKSISCIVTRNIKDYRNSHIKVLSSEQFADKN